VQFAPLLELPPLTAPAPLTATAIAVGNEPGSDLHVATDVSAATVVDEPMTQPPLVLRRTSSGLERPASDDCERYAEPEQPAHPLGPL